jgi:hypothetical protein
MIKVLLKIKEALEEAEKFDNPHHPKPDEETKQHLRESIRYMVHAKVEIEMAIEKLEDK